MKLKTIAALTISGTLATSGISNAQTSDYSNDSTQRIDPDTLAITFTPKTAKHIQCVIVKNFRDVSAPFCWDKKVPNTSPKSSIHVDNYSFSNDGHQNIGPDEKAIMFTPQAAKYKQCAVVKSFSNIGAASCWDKPPSP